MNEFEILLGKVSDFLKQEKIRHGNYLYRDGSGIDAKIPEPQIEERSEEIKKPKQTKASVIEMPPDELFGLSDAASKGTGEAWEKSKTLNELNSLICECHKCPLGETRTKFVFGVGNPNADVMFIGEAPGADEDQQGEPFVGRAGQLFNKILEAIKWKREDVYIANILKCRPPGNRDPLSSEEEMCEPYLRKQIKIIKPIIMVSLGRIAAQTLLRKPNESLGALRSKIHSYEGVPLLVTYHPAALLRNPNWKPEAWEDFKKLKSIYEKAENKKLK
jgi:uracil-DNA glycosylase